MSRWMRLGDFETAVFTRSCRDMWSRKRWVSLGMDTASSPRYVMGL